MRKNSTTTPQTPAQPNAPVMSQVSPVKAMPAPVPSGATTSPPMNQAKMADEKEEHRRIPHGAIGGAVGSLGGLAATLPSVFQAYRDLPVRMPDGHSELYALERGKFHKSLGRAAGATLLSAALGVGLERLARGMKPTAQGVHAGQQLSRRETDGPEPKQASFASMKDKGEQFVRGVGAGLGASAASGIFSPIDTLRRLKSPEFYRALADATSGAARSGNYSRLGSSLASVPGQAVGLGALGYGAYRGSKALANLLHDEEE
jgi:hypothetical protein